MNVSSEHTLPEFAFNGALVAHVVRSMSDAGLIEKLCGPGIESDEGSRASRVLLLCLDILSDFGAVTRGPIRRATPRGVELFEAHGFFTWLLDGNAPMLTTLDRVLAGEAVPIERNWAAVARGSAQAGQAYMDARIDTTLEQLAPNRPADLGCGDGSRLRRYLHSSVADRGIGVEKSEAGFRDALSVDDNAIQGRLMLVHGDCLDPMPSLGVGVDLVMSFLLLHDLLHAKGGDMSLVLKAIRDNFPDARTFLLADTTCDPFDGSGRTVPPLFVRGYELVHSIMNVPLYTKTQYLEMFEDCGLALVRSLHLGVPNTFLFHLEVPA